MSDPEFGIVLVLVVVLVLDALGFRDRKETDVLQLICSVSLIAKLIGILEDEDDDETSTRTIPQIRNLHYRIERTTPPSTRIAAPFVAADNGLE